MRTASYTSKPVLRKKRRKRKRKPRAIEGDKITAEVRDGVVSVNAPIKATAKPKRITVRAK